MELIQLIPHTPLEILQAAALLAGLVFMVLQVLQHRWMWYFNLATSVASLAVTLMSSLWASAALNAYFIVMSVIGIFSWKKLARKDGGKDRLRLVRPSSGMLVISILAAVVLCVGIWQVLLAANDASPFLDSLTLILSALATWWLTRSYKEQWYVWIVADTIALAMYVSQGLWGMAALFFFYVISSVIGLVHWQKKGTYV
ncbi:MAG: nicotinamide riboside transporter PnuC [Bacteroidales bacterium]|nr:nicotinamide riboside transporter PnuC [Bacteroidales bacterium]